MGKCRNKQVPTSKLLQTFLKLTTTQAGIPPGFNAARLSSQTANLMCPRMLPGSEDKRCGKPPVCLSRPQRSRRGGCMLQEELPETLQPPPCTGSGDSSSAKITPGNTFRSLLVQTVTSQHPTAHVRTCLFINTDIAGRFF